MPGDDLKEHATSSHDFYELLGVEFETSEADIRRAYRRTALKCHPDKNAGNPSAVEKFHLLSIAYEVLSDPTVKALYDNARRARKEKAERDSAFEGRRRQMKEDLERRESGAFKRKRDEDDEELKLEREIQRLAEDGKRRRKERDDMLNRERLEEEERQDQGANSAASVSETITATPMGGTSVSEVDRAVKVRWVREGTGKDFDKERLAELFSKFGKVDHAFLLKDKRQRIGDRTEKAIVATGVIVFLSVVGAHAAVEDIKKQSGPEYKAFEHVYWASNQEPDFLGRQKSASPAADEPAAPATPPSTTYPSFANQATASPSLEEIMMIRLKNAEKKRQEEKLRSYQETSGVEVAPKTPLKSSFNGNGLKKVPSFASLNTPKSSPFAKQTIASPALEEMTKIRLRNAEKKRLEEEIRKEDQKADEAAAASSGI